MTRHNRENLESEHTPAQIARRLNAKPVRSLLADAVLGSIDGCVTSFAIISAAHGAALSTSFTVTLGAASLLADGFSMGISNYQSVATERDQFHRLWHQEATHIEVIPEGEREEIRQIYKSKGITGTTLEQVVEAVTADRDTWIRTMLAEEHHKPGAAGTPWRAALITFLSFILVGALPLTPYLLFPGDPAQAFVWAAMSAALSFFFIGCVKANATGTSRMWGGFSVLLVGGGAAVLAYLAATFVRGMQS